MGAPLAASEAACQAAGCPLSFLPHSFPSPSVSGEDTAPYVCALAEECSEPPGAFVFVFLPVWGVGPGHAGLWDMVTFGGGVPGTLSHSLTTQVEPSWNK